MEAPHVHMYASHASAYIEMCLHRLYRGTPHVSSCQSALDARYTSIHVERAMFIELSVVASIAAGVASLPEYPADASCRVSATSA